MGKKENSVRMRKRSLGFCEKMDSCPEETHWSKLNQFLLSSRFRVNLQDGHFTAFPNKPTGWTQVVLNYIGPNNGQGLRVFYNGTQVATDNTKSTALFTSGDGRIVVGRYYTGRRQRYASVEVDKLMFFNHSLSIEQVSRLQNVDIF